MRLTNLDDAGRRMFDIGRFQWHARLIRDRSLSGAALRVAGLLLHMYNVKHGGAWPSYDYMAEQLGLSRPTVIRAVAVLEKESWITVERGAGLGGSNFYRPAFGPSEVRETGSDREAGGSGTAPDDGRVDDTLTT